MPAPLATIGLDDRQVYFLRELLSPKQLKQASHQAVTRTAGKLKTRVAQYLRDDTNIDRASSRDAVRVETDRGDIPVARLVILGRGIPLSGMKPRATKGSGVTVQPVKDRPAIHLRHAFAAIMRSGHKGVFNRARLPVFGPGTTSSDLAALGFPEDEARQLLRGNSATLAKLYGQGIRHQKRLAIGGNFPDVTPEGFAWRLPIKELKGPGAAGIIGVPERLQPLLADGQEILEKNVQSQVDRFTKPRN